MLMDRQPLSQRRLKAACFYTLFLCRDFGISGSVDSFFFSAIESITSFFGYTLFVMENISDLHRAVCPIYRPKGFQVLLILKKKIDKISFEVAKNTHNKKKFGHKSVKIWTTLERMSRARRRFFPVDIPAHSKIQKARRSNDVIALVMGIIWNLVTNWRKTNFWNRRN